MNPTNAWVIPNVSAAFCRDEDLAHERHEHRHGGQRREGEPDRPRSLVLVVCVASVPAAGGVARPGPARTEELAVRPEREEQAQRVRRDEDDREAEAQLRGEGRRTGRVGGPDGRRNQEGDGRQEELRRLELRGRRVELLHPVTQPTEEQARAQHEQRVGDDRAGDRRLDQHVLARAERGHGDHELGQVPQRRVQESADGVAGLRRDGLGRVAEERRERHDREHRQHEEEGVRVRPEVLRRQDRRDEDQQPEERRPADVAQEQGHVCLQGVPQVVPPRGAAIDGARERERRGMLAPAPAVFDAHSATAAGPEPSASSAPSTAGRLPRPAAWSR
jgi:hypothetical protein